MSRYIHIELYTGDTREIMRERIRCVEEKNTEYIVYRKIFVRLLCTSMTVACVYDGTASKSACNFLEWVFPKTCGSQVPASDRQSQRQVSIC